MVTAGDFKNGITIEYDGKICQIIEFQHVKPGKGAAFVRTKLKDIKYLYNDGDLYYFMDGETYDQIAVSAEKVGDSLKFVKENETVKICSCKGDIFAIEPPITVELQITETEPGFKGNTATNATKPAVVETGATVYVPLFVEQGETIVIDTRTGEYSKRV